jgi:hypothetical protein
LLAGAQAQPGLWGRLTAQGDKAALTQRRQASIDAKARATSRTAHATHARTLLRNFHARLTLSLSRCPTQAAREAAARESAVEAKALAARAAVEAECAEASAAREAVAAAKAEELSAQRADLAAWAGSAGAGASHVQASTSDSDSDAEPRREEGGAPLPPPLAPPLAPLPQQAPRQPLPPPRATTRVAVTLTPLQKPHLPAREAAAGGEGAQSSGGGRGNAPLPVAPSPDVAALLADARDATERHPAFLKDTGDKRLRCGDVAGALDAYGRALVLADAPSACVPAAARAALHAARACARARAGDADGAAADARAAAALAPEDAALVRTAADAADAADDAALPPEALRRAADARAAAGDMRAAMASYGRLLARPSGGSSVVACCPDAERIAAHANRAACRLGAGDAAGAAADAEAGLATLLGGAAAASEAASAAHAMLADAAADDDDTVVVQRRSVLARLLARRAAARSRLTLYAAAAEDAAAAAALRRASGDASAADALDADAAAMARMQLEQPAA